MHAIELRHNGSEGSLLVNGVDFTRVVGPEVYVAIGPNMIPRLECTLQGELMAEFTGVFVVNDVTRAALEAIGWTPPEADPTVAEAT